MTAPQYEVIIVGGRPAGSSLALRLGRAGLRVLLIEKSAACRAVAAVCAVFDELGHAAAR
ncbi:MAG: FAD-dependent monooxygenase [Polyangia bacterium]